MVHAATSCTHPANYYNLMRTIVHPYWSADPPDHRLSKKPYKTVDHHTAWVPEDSLVFKVRCLQGTSFLHACCLLHMLWLCAKSGSAAGAVFEASRSLLECTRSWLSRISLNCTAQ